MPPRDPRRDSASDTSPAAELRDTRERALTAAVRTGDEAAFEVLFREYYGPLCAFIADKVGSRETARDLTHNIFARMWRERTRLEIRGTVRGYLYAAGRFEAISHRRRQSHAAERLVLWHAASHSPGSGGPAPGPDLQVEQAELRQGIRSAVAALPPRCREILTLRWKHQLTHAEIAQTLGISAKTVENQITIGFRALRKALREHSPHLP